MRSLIFLLSFAVILTFLGGCSKKSELPEPPLILPLIRGGAIKIDLALRISEPHLYALDVSFLCPEKNSAECARIRRIAAGQDLDESKEIGKPLSLHVAMRKRMSGELMFDETVHSEKLELFSSGFGHFRKELRSFQLEAGDYDLLVEVEKMDPAMKDLEVDIEFVRPYRGK